VRPFSKVWPAYTAGVTDETAGTPDESTAAQAADVRIVLNQLELPDDFEEADLEELRGQVSALDDAVAEVVVEPGAAPRDPLVLATLFVIHFLSAHGAEIAMGVAEGAIWDGIKAAFRRLRRRDKGAAELTRVGVAYPDGTTLFVEVHSDEELERAIKALRPAAGA